MSVARSYRNDDIEVLRAVAVSLVVVHHIGYLFVWDGAWQKLFVVTTFWGGVDLFFCISGFVIASALLRESRDVAFVRFAVPFWIKRVWRIWPAAIAWAVLGIVASRVFNSTGAFGKFTANIGDGVAATTQVANFHFLGCWFYHVGVCGNEGIYWSLSLEEQFYAVFPFALFFVPRRWLPAGLLVTILLQCFFDRPIGSPLWMTRTDGICYGVLIALLRNSAPLREALYPRFMQSRAAAAAFVLGSIFLITAIPGSRIVWFDTGLLAVVCAILVFVASYDRDWVLPVPYLRRALLWLGSRSFAVYLTHNFAFWLTHEIFYRVYRGVSFDSRYTLRFAVVGFGLIGLLSEATYRLIEAPLRDRGRRIADRYRGKHAPPPGAESVAAPLPMAASSNP